MAERMLQHPQRNVSGRGTMFSTQSFRIVRFKNVIEFSFLRKSPSHTRTHSKETRWFWWGKKKVRIPSINQIAQIWNTQGSNSLIMGKGYLLNALHPSNQANALGKETRSSLKGIVSTSLGFYMKTGKRSKKLLLPWVKISVYPKKTYMPST